MYEDRAGSSGFPLRSLFIGKVVKETVSRRGSFQGGISMGDRRERIVRFAKQNSWFRYCLIGAYAAICTIPALRKKHLSLRMGLRAWLIVVALCFSQLFVVTTYAEEIAEASEDQAAESETGDAGTEDGSDEKRQDESSADEEETFVPPENNSDDTASGEDAAEDFEDTSGNEPLKDSEDVSGNNSVEAPEDVGGNDPAEDSEDVSGNNPVEAPEDTSGNDPAAGPEDISGNDPEEVQYQYIPQLFIDCRMKESAAGILVGNASSVLVLSTVSSHIDPETEDEFGMSPAVCAYGYADGKMLYADMQTGTAEISLPDNFYGSIVFTARDAAGNTCEVSTPMLLVDASAPVVSIVEKELTDGGRRVVAVLKDEGATATGIEQVSCLVDGAEVPVEYEVTGISENCFGQAVISEASYLLPLEESGCYTVRLEVKDHAGNVFSCVQVIEIPEKRGPISVTAPSRVTLTVDPWTGGEQICSDNFTIENKSGYDIIATLRSAKVTVNREDVGGDTARKDCSLYLSCDLWGDVYLPEGDSGELLSIRIPSKKEDGKTNGALSMQVHGDLSGGSEPLWKDEDIKLELYFEYRAAPAD